MSVYNCHKQNPQPWMSYISENDICDTQGCCPLLVTDTTHLLPFQIISNGSFMKLEYSPHDEDTWTIITIVYSEVVIDGFYYISYNGNAIDELECGAYDFKLTAGETWYFEPILIEDFTITENAYTLRNELMLPLKFSEQQFETLPLIAPCDAYLPFMFATENATSGTITIYLYDVVAECEVTEIDIDVEVLTISGMTYYIYEGECVYPFLDCGIYKIEIVDGLHSYFSVPIDVECNMSDIPDGSRVMLDFNRCVMRDEEGNIMYESCINELMDIDGNVYDSIIINGQEWIVQNFRTTHYADGTEIPNITNDAAWAALTSDAYCEYANSENNKDIYGLLYNQYAIDSIHELAYLEIAGIEQVGWRIPTDADLDNLAAFISDILTAGGDLKEAGTEHWLTPNTGAVDTYGFKAVPNGLRSGVSGAFSDKTTLANFWTSVETYCYFLYYNNEYFAPDTYSKKFGLSVRLVKDV